MSILLTGRDTVSIVLKDITSSLATDSPASLEMIEDFADEIVGKNGNSIIFRKPKGRHCILTLNVLQGSDGETWINTFTSTLDSFKLFTPIYGNIEQRLGDGNGKVKSKLYFLTGLFIKEKPIQAKIMTYGGIEESVVVYKLQGLVE